MTLFAFVSCPLRNHFIFDNHSNRYLQSRRPRTVFMATTPSIPRPIVVASSLNADISVQVEIAPIGGETVTGQSVEQSLGGKGANVAVAAVRAQSSNNSRNVHLAAVRGEDAVGASLTAELRKTGMNLSLLKIVENTGTGTAIIVVEANGENRIIVTPGANAYFGNGLMNDAEFWERLTNAVVVLHLEIAGKEVMKIAEGAQKRGGIVILNPSPVGGLKGFENEILRNVDYVIVNEIEVMQISGLKDAGENVEKAAMMVARKCRSDACVVVTRGKKDLLIVKKENIEVVEAAEAKTVVDTTCAGDTLTGYLAAGIADGKDIESSVKLAVVAASMAVEKRGASVAIPTISEVRRRMTEATNVNVS